MKAKLGVLLTLSICRRNVRSMPGQAMKFPKEGSRR